MRAPDAEPDSEPEVEPEVEGDRRRMRNVATEQVAVERETERILARMASGASLDRVGEALVAAEA